MNSATQFLYVHDPMCSWCWGHRPVWDQLEAQLEHRVPVRYCVGGLAPDSDVPMPDETKGYVIANWQNVEQKLGAQFNYDFWTQATPRRSTYPACRAVLAARSQQAEKAMIDALQQAYYLRALNPSDTDVHLQLADELNLDVARFGAELSSTELDQRFREEMAFARSLPIEGFPSMLLLHNGQVHPLELNYLDYRAALAQVDRILA